MNRRRKTDPTKREEAEDGRFAQVMIDSLFNVWNQAIDACIDKLETRWDDHNMIAEIKKLKK